MADQQTEQMGADFRTGEEENVDQLVLYEKIDKHIALITLNRPERLNAMLAPYSFQELGRKMAMAQDDDEIKVIILTGAGRAFSAGVDLRRTPIEAAGLRPGQRLPQSLRMHRPGGGGERANILNSDKTTIAAVNGDAVAAGFHVVMQCDLVVASETARMGEPEARIGFAGFTPDMVMMLLKMGINRGREAILTGRMMPAKELHEWGIVNSVVPQDQVMDEALRYAKMVAWHSTDNLMLGRRSMRLFWDLMGVPAYNTWSSIAHPLFTNVVWRDDEFNFLRERNKSGLRGAFDEMRRQWTDMGFPD